MPTSAVPIIRPLGGGDSIEELTEMLHRAYGRLADMGLRFYATHQTPSQTRERIDDGECLVAVLDGRIVGTILYCNTSRAGGTAWYDREDVAYFGQFGVEPSMQGNGIGNRLLEHVEALAAREGASELALDTAEGATHLIDYYTRHGYRFIQHAQWNLTNYRSVVLSKRLDVPTAEENAAMSPGPA